VTTSPQEAPAAATRLRGILFDLDVTLADNPSAWDAVWPEVAEKLAGRYAGFDPDAFRQREVETSERHYELLVRGDVDFPTYRRNFLRESLEPWGELDDETLALYVDGRARALDAIKLYPDALETVRGLRRLGLKVGVLTNGPSDLQRRKLALLGLEGELDAVAISGELGVSKPDPEAFRAAVALLGLEPAEVAMVGDHIANDVAGALAAGLGAAVWVERYPGELPEGARLARELAEVPRLLGLAP
jgi:putative hydrolase of the HAD superfamily